MSLEFLTGDLAAPHGFFTRKGGVSLAPYASLNCSMGSADAPENIAANRARVANILEVPPERLLGLKQVHGATVHWVTSPWELENLPVADAMITCVPGLALGIVTADCAPVLFSDPDGACVGAAHAGWRGALAGVLEATGIAMREKGAMAVRAVIGPCIGRQSYDVGANMRDAVLQPNPNDAIFFSAGKSLDKWQFDLAGYCASRLARIDLPVTIIARDTCAEEENFFSHRRRTLRRESAIGHQISAIRVRA